MAALARLRTVVEWLHAGGGFMQTLRGLTVTAADGQSCRCELQLRPEHQARRPPRATAATTGRPDRGPPAC